MNNMFSKNLDYIIKSEKLTAKQILKITGHNSKSLISMWKSGERFITTEDAVKLANALGCTIDDLINNDLREINNQFDSLTEAFLQNRHKLTDDDKDTIKFIIEKRVKNDGKNN